MVLGFGCKLETILPADKRFRHAFDDVAYDRLTAKEVAMLCLMDSITDKSNWKTKIRNPKMIEKWRAEAMAVSPMSDAAFNWYVEEIQDKTGWNDDNFVLTVDTGSRCAKGDNVVPESVLQDLRSQVPPLLREPKDWHPGSNERMLDLVHPSLYPSVYGKTRVKSQGKVGLTEVVLGDNATLVIPAIPDTLLYP